MSGIDGCMHINRISPRPSRAQSPPRSRSDRPPPPPSAPEPHSKSQAIPVPEMEMELDLQPEQPVAETLAARRARRQAIMAKYAGIASSEQGPTPSPGPSSAVEPPPATPDMSNLPSRIHSANGTPAPIEPVRKEAASESCLLSSAICIEREAPLAGAVSRDSASASPTPGGIFSLAKGDEEERAQVDTQEDEGAGEQVSAADYDPSLDRREDEHKRVWGGNAKEEPADVEMIEDEEEVEEDDVDDMFAVTTTEKKVKKVKRVVVSSARICQPQLPLTIGIVRRSLSHPH